MQNEELLLFVFAGGILYYQLSKSSIKTLLSLLLMAAFAGAVFYYVVRTTRKDRVTAQASDAKVGTSLEGRKEIASASYPVKRASTKLKYLPRNAVFMDLLKDLRFVRIYDKARYGDLVIHLEKLQKVYMYILARRYSCEQHIPIFTDLRDQVSEILYSLYVIIPESMKHTYGVQPHNILEKNITEFTAITRRMLDILKSFCRDEGAYYPEQLPRPHEPAREHIMP